MEGKEIVLSHPVTTDHQVRMQKNAKEKKQQGKKGTKKFTVSFECDFNMSEFFQSKLTRVLDTVSTVGTGYSFTSIDGYWNLSPSMNYDFMSDYVSNLEGNMDADKNREVKVSIQLKRDVDLDFMLWMKLETRKYNAQYKKMVELRKKLPAYACRRQLTDAIIQNQVTIISGETGSGKTTQVPQFILHRWVADGNGSVCNIICTQPRRLSTIGVAERVALERGESIGNSIGYSVRLEKKLPKRRCATLTFLVTGVLLQRLRLDPLLNGVSHVIVDEVHERENLSDFILVVLKDLIRKRPDLKVILMSATLNAEKFSEYFGGCAIFHIPGVTFPVTQYYLEDVLERTHFVFRQDPKQRQSRPGYVSPHEHEFRQLILPWISELQAERQCSTTVLNELRKVESEEINFELIQATLEHIISIDNSNGAVLIFVTGWDHISKLMKQFESCGKFPSHQFLFYPLHSQIPTATQKEIFKRPPQGVRKVIIATNIAETSITIDDVLFVIDCGKIKQTNFNVKLNLQTLDNEWVSRANAQQRRGRAGRVRAGICFHLYSRGRERLLEDYKLPEIRRMKLEEPVLKIKNLKYGNAAAFFKRFLDPPNEMAVTTAVERLHKIGALDSWEQLTPLGFHLSKLPMDPYTGKMILMASIFSCVDPILSCAASLNITDCFRIPLKCEEEAYIHKVRRNFSEGTRSDHIAVIKAVEGYEEAEAQGMEEAYCLRHFLSNGSLKHLQGMKQEFAQYLHEMEFLATSVIKDPIHNRNSRNIALIKAIICAGLYPNVGIAKKRVAKKSKKVLGIDASTYEDGRVRIHPKSVNCKPEEEVRYDSAFLYFRKMKSSKIFLYDTTMVTPLPIILFGGKLVYSCVGKPSRNCGTLDVDGLKFRCSTSVYEKMKALREKLDEVLGEKMQNPGPAKWERLPAGCSFDSTESFILRAIRGLIMAEYNNRLNGTPGARPEEVSPHESTAVISQAEPLQSSPT